MVVVIIVMTCTLVIVVLHRLRVTTTIGYSNSAVVCSGDRLMLTCSSSNHQMLWTVTSPHTPNNTHTVAVLMSGVVSPPSITVNNAVFRVSTTSISPVTSEVIVESVMANVNGTRVTCSHSEAMTTVTTIIVINGMVPHSCSYTL